MRLTMNDSHPIRNLVLTWVTALYGALTMQNIALGLAACYSALQIYVIVRDKILKRGDRESESGSQA